MPEIQAYTFGSAEGAAAVIAAIPARHQWRLTFIQEDIDALRAALTEAAAGTCLSGCPGCPQGCWSGRVTELAGELPVTPRDLWDWVLEPDGICTGLQALVAAWDHECAQHQNGSPQDCWRFTAGNLAGDIAESAGVQWI